MGIWSSEERKQYFSETGIDPYKVLGVSDGMDVRKIKKKYHKLALKCHPDKVKGSTGLEFKILKECYKFILDEMDIVVEEKRVDNIEEYSRIRENSNYSIDETRNLLETDFESDSKRKELFAVNTLDFSENKRIIKEKESNLIDTGSSFMPKNIFENRKKFNIKYFNDVFDVIKGEKKESQLVSVKESLIDNKIHSNGSISYYDGVIIEKESKDKGNYIELKENEVNFRDIPEKELKKLIREKNAKAKAAGASANANLITKREPILLPPKNSNFSDLTHVLLEKRAINTRESLRNNREYIRSKAGIYPGGSLRLT